MSDSSAKSSLRIHSSHVAAKPFLKWAGGKSQLLGQLETYFPPELVGGQIRCYIEPFIGSGAVFFHITQKYPVDTCIVSDINPELILVYRTVQNSVEDLIEAVAEIEGHYLHLSEMNRKDYYYTMRDRYNHQRREIDFNLFSWFWIERTALFIFLNRTGYNGLFRLNSSGEFNVPFGRYENPRLLDAKNLRRVAQLLQNVNIQYGDFEAVEISVGADTLVYFDPPYRPISGTARFTSYSKDNFGDREQLRLADFYRHLDARGAKLMLSNSDPNNEDPQDDFFSRAYEGFRIERLRARRNINSQSRKRGPISELLILNY
jgi:DNA adenine methylase